MPGPPAVIIKPIVKASSKLQLNDPLLIQLFREVINKRIEQQNNRMLVNEMDMQDLGQNLSERARHAY